MGWWSPAGRDGVAVGDEVFDRTYRYLEEVTALYREGVGRAPTVEELATVLTVALQNHGGSETFEGVDELEVSSVAIKTKKRPKRPRLQVGDVFTIPLEAGKWGFGRIVNLEREWDLVEIFAHVSPKPRYTPAAIASGRLLPPIPVDVNEAFIEGDGRWRVVHSQPGFRLEDLDKLEYDSGTGRIMRVNTFNWEVGSPGYLAKLPPFVLKGVQGYEEEIKDGLRAHGLLGPKLAT